MAGGEHLTYSSFIERIVLSAHKLATHNSSPPCSTAILLAAGEGSRLGGLPKALIKVDGTSIMARQLKVLHEAGIAHVTVVTGHFHEQIEPALTALSFLGMSIGLVRNAAPERGQGSSVRLGMESILHQGQQSADTNAVVVMLSDQPLVDAQDLTGLLDNFYHRAYGEVLIPYSNGDR